MMVKQTGGQMIYAVQFHLEKSFEDWSKNPTRWEHPNESRDGRILFENFLKLALKHKKLWVSKHFYKKRIYYCLIIIRKCVELQ